MKTGTDDWLCHACLAEAVAAQKAFGELSVDGLSASSSNNANRNHNGTRHTQQAPAQKDEAKADQICEESTTKEIKEMTECKDAMPDVFLTAIFDMKSRHDCFQRAYTLAHGHVPCRQLPRSSLIV